MKFALLFAVTLIALVSAVPAPDDPLEVYKQQLVARVDAQEKLTEKDIKHFDTTKLKDSPQQKELKNSMVELEGFRPDIKKGASVEQLEPVERNLGYLESWEPYYVEEMEKLLHQ
ncbi:unnamed protein product [Medioppia subpectinata]|uniref:Uncharacterized protein n=1 Tax=Medioppia subpectinata TaxID=1979941 RepID=A0A7R9QGB7_9ACAR|nr:unnamed protein product [Medioppia subpectinata]CAG2119848.1 unnamed protein product [Medioppia subpectinata]